MANLYALLVGINNYPISPLQGSINDVDSVEGFLKTAYPESDLSIKRLTDNDSMLPTRENVIRAFDHFNEAANDDVCLFYYSGHGSFSAAPEEFWSETTGFLQSFVFEDSRFPGGRDLMDKEMSYLIWKSMIESKKKDVTFIAITDCCHAGTITKALADNSEIIDKMEKPNPVPTSFQDYLGFGITIGGEPAYKETIDVITGKKRITTAQGNHIHIASSRDNQTSKELVIDGKRRSAFTYAMLKVLYACGGNIGYKELVDKTSIQVKNIVPDQYPLINWNGDIQNLQPGIEKKIFLLNKPTETQETKFNIYFNGQYGKWCLSAGKLQNVTEGDVAYIMNGIETFVLPSPFPDFSFVQRLDCFETNQQYIATIIRTTDKVTQISIADDIPANIKQLFLNENWTSGLFTLSKDKPGKFIIRKNDLNEYFLALPGSNKPINDPQSISSGNDVTELFSEIDTICKWINLQEFNNPTSKLGANDSEIRLFRDTSEGKFEELKEILPINDLYYKNASEKPIFRMQIINNRSTGNLFISYVYLGFDYKINTSWFESQEVAPGKEAWLKLNGNSSDGITMEVDDDFIKLGYDEITEYLKIFISTEPIDLYTKEQKGIELPFYRTKNIDPLVAEKSPSGIMDIPLFSGKDWKTELIGFRIIKPIPERSISAEQDTRIAGITILKHEISGNVTVTDSNKLNSVFNYLSNTKSFDAKSVNARPDAFVKSPNTVNGNSYLEPFDLSIGNAMKGMLMDVLELSSVSNKDLVTPENPLIIQLPMTKSSEEDSILPIGFDTETKLYYPIGHYDEKERRIYLHTLPDETPNDAAITQKSFFGSIKIYFQKVIGSKHGFIYKYPRLAVATVNDLLEVSYEDDEKKVSDAIEEATDIIVFIHGIIGDTESIVKCIKTPLETNSKTLKKDASTLILTFDYENLNTSIKQTATDLGDRLSKVGLKKGHKKNLILIAHSMGGLVSRWFIEKEDGYEVVNKLIMLGTPNNGSNWTDVRDLADTLLTFALNGAALLKPWMLLLSKVFGHLVKDVQITLIEMGPTSDFIKDLNDKNAPEIPYIVIAGNTQKIIVKYDNTSSLIEKLFSRVKKKGVYDALDALLFKKPNDIAVTDESILTFTTTTSAWVIKPQAYEVSCDHLNYFVDIGSLTLIKQALI